MPLVWNNFSEKMEGIKDFPLRLGQEFSGNGGTDVRFRLTVKLGKIGNRSLDFHIFLDCLGKRVHLLHRTEVIVQFVLVVI